MRGIGLKDFFDVDNGGVALVKKQGRVQNQSKNSYKNRAFINSYFLEVHNNLFWECFIKFADKT